MLLVILICICYRLRHKAIFYIGNFRHALSEAGCVCWEREERYSCHDRYNVPLVNSRSSSRRSSTHSRAGTARRNTSFNAKYRPGEDERSLRRHYEYLNTAPRSTDNAGHAKKAADAADSAAAAAAGAATRAAAATGPPTRPPVTFSRLSLNNGVFRRRKWPLK